MTKAHPPPSQRQATKGEAPMQVRAHQGFYENPPKINREGHSHDQG